MKSKNIHTLFFKLLKVKNYMLLYYIPIIIGCLFNLILFLKIKLFTSFVFFYFINIISYIYPNSFNLLINLNNLNDIINIEIITYIYIIFFYFSPFLIFIYLFFFKMLLFNYEIKNIYYIIIFIYCFFKSFNFFFLVFSHFFFFFELIYTPKQLNLNLNLNLIEEINNYLIYNIYTLLIFYFFYVLKRKNFFIFIFIFKLLISNIFIKSKILTYIYIIPLFFYIHFIIYKNTAKNGRESGIRTHDKLIYIDFQNQRFRPLSHS